MLCRDVFERCFAALRPRRSAALLGNGTDDKMATFELGNIALLRAIDIPHGRCSKRGE
jgi:hypothetical protein